MATTATETTDQGVLVYQDTTPQAVIDATHALQKACSEWPMASGQTGGTQPWLFSVDLHQSIGLCGHALHKSSYELDRAYLTMGITVLAAITACFVIYVAYRIFSNLFAGKAS